MCVQKEITTKWEHYNDRFPPTSTVCLRAMPSLGVHGLFLQHALVATVLFLHFPPRKRTPCIPWFFKIYLFIFNLSVSPESSLVRHWCPWNCPHQGHRRLPILHSIQPACPVFQQDRLLTRPPLWWCFLDLLLHSVHFRSIPFIPPTPSTAPQALTWPLLFLWVTSLDVLSQCPPAMPHPQMLLCLRA